MPYTREFFSIDDVETSIADAAIGPLTADLETAWREDWTRRSPKPRCKTRRCQTRDNRQARRAFRAYGFPARGIAEYRSAASRRELVNAMMTAEARSSAFGKCWTPCPIRKSRWYRFASWAFSATSATPPTTRLKSSSRPRIPAVRRCTDCGRHWRSVDRSGLCKISHWRQCWRRRGPRLDDRRGSREAEEIRHRPANGQFAVQTNTLRKSGRSASSRAWWQTRCPALRFIAYRTPRPIRLDGVQGAVSLRGLPRAVRLLQTVLKRPWRLRNSIRCASANVRPKPPTPSRFPSTSRQSSRCIPLHARPVRHVEDAYRW